jgi:ABC-type dipeptide/oligopeptide/nickel transport system permease component
MLTEKEEQFIAYWRTQRDRKQRAGFAIGLPLGVLIVAALFINILTGWHKQGAAALSSDYSTILVIVIAAIAIVIFMTRFASSYLWEQREQRYNELLAKKGASQNNSKETF